MNQKAKIKELKKHFEKLKNLRDKLTDAEGGVAGLINDLINIDGAVDWLAGDGYGYCPIIDEYGDDTDGHCTIESIIDMLEEGKEVKIGDLFLTF